MGYKRVVITEFGGPEVLKIIEDTQLPEPKFGEVRVKVLVTSAAFTDILFQSNLDKNEIKKVLVERSLENMIN